VPYFDQDLGGLTADWVAADGAFLLGRRTCGLFATSWSQVTDPGDPRATRLNARSVTPPLKIFRDTGRAG
jgi:hypothetical protein